VKKFVPRLGVKILGHFRDKIGQNDQFLVTFIIFLAVFIPIVLNISLQALQNLELV
jgi:hypothetical protein